MTIGVRKLTAKLPRMTSAANITPASGAPNVALMPAAVPLATSTLTLRWSSRDHWPMRLPAAEPICTIGPSRPTDPPVPIVGPLASVLNSATRGRMTPPLRATAEMTSGTPCPCVSGAKRRVSQLTSSSSPAAGTATINHGTAEPITASSVPARTS